MITRARTSAASSSSVSGASELANSNASSQPAIHMSETSQTADHDQQDEPRGTTAEPERQQVQSSPMPVRESFATNAEYVTALENKYQRKPGYLSSEASPTPPASRRAAFMRVAAGPPEHIRKQMSQAAAAAAARSPQASPSEPDRSSPGAPADSSHASGSTSAAGAAGAASAAAAAASASPATAAAPPPQSQWLHLATDTDVRAGRVLLTADGIRVPIQVVEGGMSARSLQGDQYSMLQPGDSISFLQPLLTADEIEETGGSALALKIRPDGSWTDKYFRAQVQPDVQDGCVRVQYADSKNRATLPLEGQWVEGQSRRVLLPTVIKNQFVRLTRPHLDSLRSSAANAPAVPMAGSQPPERRAAQKITPKSPEPEEEEEEDKSSAGSSGPASVSSDMESQGQPQGHSAAAAATEPHPQLATVSHIPIGSLVVNSTEWISEVTGFQGNKLEIRRLVADPHKPKLSNRVWTSNVGIIEPYEGEPRGLKRGSHYALWYDPVMKRLDGGYYPIDKLAGSVTSNGKQTIIYAGNLVGKVPLGWQTVAVTDKYGSCTLHMPSFCTIRKLKPKDIAAAYEAWQEKMRIKPTAVIAGQKATPQRRRASGHHPAAAAASSIASTPASTPHVSPRTASAQSSASKRARKSKSMESASDVHEPEPDQPTTPVPAAEPPAKRRRTAESLPESKTDIKQEVAASDAQRATDAAAGGSGLPWAGAVSPPLTAAAAAAASAAPASASTRQPPAVAIEQPTPSSSIPLAPAPVPVAQASEPVFSDASLTIASRLRALGEEAAVALEQSASRERQLQQHVRQLTQELANSRAQVVEQFLQISTLSTQLSQVHSGPRP